jgi:hypothetical protein
MEGRFIGIEEFEVDQTDAAADERLLQIFEFLLKEMIDKDVF